MTGVGFVPVCSGQFVGRTKVQVSSRRVAVAPSKSVVVRAGLEGPKAWWRSVQVAAFTAMAGCGMMFAPRSAEAKVQHNLANVETKEKTVNNDLGTLFVVGGAVLGALALKKKFDSAREAKETERRREEQQELMREGKYVPMDLREIEQRKKTEEAFATMDVDSEGLQDDDLMKELQKKINKIQKPEDDGDGDGDDSDPNNRPGADGRQDYSSRGNTGSATLEPPSDKGEPRGRPRRPIQRPRKNDPRRRPQPPASRRPAPDSEAKGGTIPPKDPKENVDDNDNVSKENLDMLRRMWEISGGEDSGSGKPGQK